MVGPLAVAASEDAASEALSGIDLLATLLRVRRPVDFSGVTSVLVNGTSLA